MRILMMASFGMEIAECGGALAKAVRQGHEVHAAVLMSREESRPQIAESAARLGITAEVEFLGYQYGEVEVTGDAKVPVVSLLRRVRPDVIIMQDPEHAQHDLDPDRRMIALLYSEAMAIAGRDWRIEECGGHEPTPIPTIYYMTPSSPNCIVEISDVIDVKLSAFESLTYQMAFSAQVLQQRMGSHISNVLPDWDPDASDTDKGLAIVVQSERANALYHGIAGHSGAVMGEAYRKEGAFTLDELAP